MIVRQDGGEPVELTAGSAAFFPIGVDLASGRSSSPSASFYVVYK